ncbi:Na(+)/H(+) antiporter subunit E1 [Aquimixticola soesokkakensis]|uniref:Na(+)/H(+) antiporter subunit E1 n=1 Tax=Aquimixticola soesokkakensis TaxID=1519096 RepID=A0A1Y5RUC0_9RHOB|nr:Na+/H+ antiporter subunit E [Aquimixticola soesokkakensis]SLN24430.1 Na(+)/H(+) antiporter subunit E1 [Aquimixticola soesokkakensis]
MKLFLLNLLLTIMWAGLSGSFAPLTLLTGFVVSFAGIWLANRSSEGISYATRVLRMIRLMVYFFVELALSSVKVAVDVLRIKPRHKPGIVEMPLDVTSDIEILLVANLISLTPGSLTLDVTPDRRALVVHSMFAHDPQALVADLKSGMERMVKEVFEE